MPLVNRRNVVIGRFCCAFVKATDGRAIRAGRDPRLTSAQTGFCLSVHNGAPSSADPRRRHRACWSDPTTRDGDDGTPPLPGPNPYTFGRSAVAVGRQQPLTCSADGGSREINNFALLSAGWSQIYRPASGKEQRTSKQSSVTSRPGSSTVFGATGPRLAAAGRGLAQADVGGRRDPWQKRSRLGLAGLSAASDQRQLLPSISCIS